MTGDHLDKYSFPYLIEEALSMITNTVDKRQGSIIYDALAVSDVQLAEGYIQLKGFYLDTYALTAKGEALAMRTGERGVNRLEATRAVKLGILLGSEGQSVAAPVGARFSTARDASALIYRITGIYTENGVSVPGKYMMECESAGTAGNSYTGSLLPLEYGGNIATAELTELLIPARDEENDEALLERYLELINNPPFGGNVSQYRKWILEEMDGVGDCRIYPVWKGGGTVGVSIIGADYNVASDTLVREVKDNLDPEEFSGDGVGLAPIGHRVTVATPEPESVNIEASVSLANGYVVGQVLSDAQSAVSAYLLSLRKEFGKNPGVKDYAINVYRSRVSAELLQVTGIENVTELRINGLDEDLVLEQGAELQRLPVDGTVTLHEI